MSPRPDLPRSLHGVLVVDKPEGPTSHDVVERIRRLAGGQRAGHTGTLDPMASGVLVVCLGAATRLARFLGAGTKEYTGMIVFGAATDTYDAQGRVVATRPTGNLDMGAIRGAASAFLGESLQVPPPWSAKKIGGRRAHELARSGRQVLPPAGRVRIEAFEVGPLEGDRCGFRVVCSAGTYVRSLANDLGSRLGCGAHLASLRRSRNGPFTESEAAGPAAIEEAALRGGLGALVRPPESLDLGMPVVGLTPAGEAHARAGRRIPETELTTPLGPEPGSHVRLLSAGGRLVAVAEVVLAGGVAPVLQPRVVLDLPEPR